MDTSAMDRPPSHEDKLIFCRALANLVTADRKVTVEEREHLAALIMDVGLSPFDEDVKALVDKELAKPSPIEEIVKGIQHPALRVLVFRSMIEIALADGWSPEEEAHINKVVKVFGFNAAAAQDVVKLAQEEQSVHKHLEAALMKL